MTFNQLLRLCTIASLFYCGVASPLHASSSKLPIEVFAQDHQMGPPKLSPEGDFLAYSFKIKDKETVIFYETETKKKFAVPLVGKSELAWYTWANNDYLLISYHVEVANDEDYYTSQMARFNPKTKKFNWVTNGKNNPSGDNVIDFLPNEPDVVLMQFSGDKGATIWRQNIMTGEDKLIQEPRRGLWSYRPDRTGAIRYGFGIDHQRGRIGSYKSARTGKWENAGKKQWFKDKYSLISFTKDPEVAYMQGQSQYGTEGLYKVNMETSEVLDTLYEHAEVDIDYISFTDTNSNSGLPIKGKISGVHYTIDQPSVHYLSKYSSKLQAIVDNALPGTRNVIRYQTRKKKLFVIDSQGPNDAGVYYLLNLATGSLDAIGEKMPGINPKYLGEIERVDIPVRDGSKIPGYITRANAETVRASKPVIVMPHGGPHARDMMVFDRWAQFLANRGYTVLQPNFRGSSGYGKKYEEAGKDQWGGLMQHDVTDATHWLIKEGIANKDNICIVGASYGGYATLMGLIQEPDLYRCGVSINGLADLKQLSNFLTYRVLGGHVLMEGIGLKDESLKSVSPLHQADKITKPVLLIAAKNDGTVKYTHAKKMYKKLKSKKQSKLVILDKGGHSLATPEARTVLFTNLEEFLEKHMK